MVGRDRWARRCPRACDAFGAPGGHALPRAHACTHRPSPFPINMRRRFSFFLALAAAISLATGCSKNKNAAPGNESAGHAAAGKKILHFGNQAEPQDIDPHTVSGLPEHRLAITFYEGLVSEDPQLNIAPGVAERWEISADGLVYTFHLRSNAKWSNGDPVTADDFVQSYRRVLTPALASEYAYMLYNHVKGAK